MDHVKNLMSPTGRYDWSSVASRYITEKCNTLCSKGDVFQLKTRGKSTIGVYLSILLLGYSQGTAVNTQLHIVDGGS